MPQRKKSRVIYYSDEKNDDFAGNNIRTREVGRGFRYINRSPVWRFFAAFVYYGVACPLVFVAAKFWLGITVRNRRAVRKCREGCFLYCNHTNYLDAFVPPLAAFPKKVYTVAGADAVSIPGLRGLVMMLGCLPVPTKASAMSEFKSVVEDRFREKPCIAIFPEAHIWPYYTGIRRFSPVSFTYPAELSAPIVAACVTYHKRRGVFALMHRPGMRVFLSDPIFAPGELSDREKRDWLADSAYEYMKKISSAENSVEYIRYKKNTDGKKSEREQNYDL